MTPKSHLACPVVGLADKDTDQLRISFRFSFLLVIDDRDGLARPSQRIDRQAVEPSLGASLVDSVGEAFFRCLQRRGLKSVVRRAGNGRGRGSSTTTVRKQQRSSSCGPQSRKSGLPPVGDGSKPNVWTTGVDTVGQGSLLYSESNDGRTADIETPARYSGHRRRRPVVLACVHGRQRTTFVDHTWLWRIMAVDPIHRVRP